MWQYTTETIINSNKGKLEGGKLFYADADKIYIEGVGAFEKANIKGAWMRPYAKAENAEGKMAMPTSVVADAVYRLQVWVSEEGTIRPELQNAMLMKSLPFQFEVVAPSKTPEDLAKAFVKAINKMFTKKGADRLFIAELGGSDDIKLTATDCYVRFDEVRIDQVPSGELDLNGYQNYKTTDAVWTEGSRGTEGNGTVARLVKNLRIPTKTSLDPFGAWHGGKPVPGGEYDQYMFEYVTDRSHAGHQVFGSVGDKSLTTHVFFVEKAASSDFGKLIKFTTYAPTKATVESAKEGMGAKK